MVTSVKIMIIFSMTERSVGEEGGKLLVAATMRKVGGRTCKLKLGTMKSSSGPPRTRAIWQVDPLALHSFHNPSDQIAVRFTIVAKRNGRGLPFKVGGRTEHLRSLLLADNYQIIAMSPGQLRRANDCLQSSLKKYGWLTDVAYTNVGSIAGVSDFIQPGTYQGKHISRCPRKEGYTVLGPMLISNKRNDRELERRIREHGSLVTRTSLLYAAGPAPCRNVCPISLVLCILLFSRVLGVGT